MQCPKCGSEIYVGDTCQVCGYVVKPKVEQDKGEVKEAATNMPSMKDEDNK